ncbi:MAG: sulfite exporter TauE/SafE family protein [Methylacidiphilales bacterium]|nr:sulfite exporter TauE/SafE family protein [Candidatus Methylacidiphilales bacterium]
MNEIMIGLLIGTVAQLSEMIIGLGYGAISSSALLAFGFSPIIVTASVHTAEAVTLGATTLRYYRAKLLEKGLIRRLVIPGIIGTIIGFLVVLFIPTNILKPYICLYLVYLGVSFVVRKTNAPSDSVEPRSNQLASIALVGGFFDTVGGGGWGPIVTGNLLRLGYQAKRAIVASVCSKWIISFQSALLFSIVTISQSINIIIGLTISGVALSYFAPRLSGLIKNHGLLIKFVGLFVIIVNLYTLNKLLHFN